MRTYHGCDLHVAWIICLCCMSAMMSYSRAGATGPERTCTKAAQFHSVATEQSDHMTSNLFVIVSGRWFTEPRKLWLNYQSNVCTWVPSIHVNGSGVVKLGFSVANKVSLSKGVLLTLCDFSCPRWKMGNCSFKYLVFYHGQQFWRLCDHRRPEIISR